MFFCTTNTTKRITEKVELGDVGTADALVEQALTFYLDYEEGEMDEDEYREAKAAIDGLSR